MMKDCNSDIHSYHQDAVVLSQAQRSKLKKQCSANRDRVRNGLEDADDPAPREFIRQGSDAMHTTTQAKDRRYDIDDGVVFEAEDMEGKSGLAARRMVQRAVDDGSFETPPEVRKNCVRIQYKEGPHVDMPVYRRSVDDNDVVLLELASSDWKESDPKGVTQWFEDCISSRSDKGRDQMRILVRLVKAYCKNRSGLPSGLVMSVLTNEKYLDYDKRLDRAFRDLIEAIRDRLEADLKVKHPVVDEWLTEGWDDPKTTKLLKCLKQSCKVLQILDRSDCTRADALQAWADVFKTDYFDAEIKKAKEAEKVRATAAVAALPSRPQPKPYGA